MRACITLLMQAKQLDLKDMFHGSMIHHLAGKRLYHPRIILLKAHNSNAIYFLVGTRRVSARNNNCVSKRVLNLLLALGTLS